MPKVTEVLSGISSGLATFHGVSELRWISAGSSYGLS